MRSLQGEFSSMVQGLTDALIDLRTYVEAAIDFPEEEVDFLGDEELRERLATVRGHFDGIVKAASQGRLLRDGMTVVLAGRPEFRQVQPAQPPGRLRGGHRHRHSGHHARRAA